MSCGPPGPRVTQYCDYLVDCYISENSNFPPFLWAAYSASRARSTNAYESFHSIFNSNFNNTKAKYFFIFKRVKKYANKQLIAYSAEVTISSLFFCCLK
jgi:hypothetical protein